MAVYRPHEISTLLCYLFDAKPAVISIDDFAKLVSLNPEYVEKLTNKPATKIDGPTRYQLGKVIAAFHRKYPRTKPPSEYEFEQRRLKLVSEADNDTRIGTPRCVREEPDPPPGMRSFKSIDSNGEFVEQRWYRREHVTRQAELRIRMGMEIFLDFINPVEDTMSGEP